MHTLRCSEDDIRRFMTDGAHEVITLALDDRFGDNGVVGLAVVRKGSGEWTLHLLLMSCRVLGRTVEQCFIYWIAGRARRSGARALDGEFAPTARNRPFAGFYSSCGFQPGQESGGIARWRLDLASARCDCPDWMHIVERPPAQAP
jgi:FkbH-like protein